MVFLEEDDLVTPDILAIVDSRGNDWSETEKFGSSDYDCSSSQNVALRFLSPRLMRRRDGLSTAVKLVKL